MKKKSQLGKLMILLAGLALCAPTQSSELAITVDNPSFELPGSGTLITNWSGIDGWSGSAGSDTGVEKNEYYSPVDGEWYAFHAGSDSSYTYQETNHTITAGERYTLKVWARSINSTGNLDTTTAEVRFYYGSTEITSVTQNVNPVQLLGVPRDEANDDGGNVWIDQGYRHEFADIHMYQNINADPLTNSWYACWDDYADYHNLDAWAVSPVIVPGHKWVYGDYADDSVSFAEIRFIEALSGGTPAYNWTNNYTSVLYTDDGDEDPWVIDPHLYYDDATGRLWMSWGGGTLWVCEMDPTDGMLINHPLNKDYNAHPEYHTAVAYWNGDEWTGDNEWFEGPALYKHNGYWYLFGSYGHLALNYTIRMGRGTSPTGPFYDKDGIAMTEWDSSESEYGNTLILGADGGQANPGHPHIWEESGKYYMGYDYTDEYDNSGTDRLGIRRLYWVDDWPVVAYKPIEVTFNANHYPAAIGQTLGISLRNTGSGSNAAFDYVSLTYTPSPPPTPDMDGSGDVNFVDYSLFTAQWMRTDCNDCNGADFTNDGNNVDYNDLDIFVDNWLRDYGLLGYWQLDGDANDSSGYGNDGTVQGGAGWLDDPNRGWCLSLGGGGDYVQIPADANLNAGKITMAAWVKASNPTPATPMHVLNRQMTQPGTYVLWLTGATKNYKWSAQIRLDGSEGSPKQIYSNDAATTDWTHIAATYDGSVFKMYINGILQTDTDAAVGSIDDDNSGILTIGAHPDPKSYFAGLIDEVYIYDKALNQQAIEKLAGI